MAGHQELYIIGKRNLRVCERKRSEVLWSYFHGKYKALTLFALSIIVSVNRHRCWYVNGTCVNYPLRVIQGQLLKSKVAEKGIAFFNLGSYCLNILLCGDGVIPS